MNNISEEFISYGKQKISEEGASEDVEQVLDAATKDVAIEDASSKSADAVDMKD